MKSGKIRNQTDSHQNLLCYTPKSLPEHHPPLTTLTLDVHLPSTVGWDAFRIIIMRGIEKDGDRIEVDDVNDNDDINDEYGDGYDGYDDQYDDQSDDGIPLHILIPLLISLWGIMSLCLCIYTHKYIWRSPAVSKLCMYVVLCSLGFFFATIFAFKPPHENDGWYYGPESNWRRFNKRSYERWRVENGDVELTWTEYGGWSGLSEGLRCVRAVRGRTATWTLWQGSASTWKLWQ